MPEEALYIGDNATEPVYRVKGQECPLLHTKIPLRGQRTILAIDFELLEIIGHPLLT